MSRSNPMNEASEIKASESQRFTFRRYKQTRFWAVTDERGELVAVTVYKKGAQAVASRLTVQYVYSLTEAGRQALEDANNAE